MRAVIGLGRGLGLPVLAEGVETLDELEFLSSELCNEAQGYLIGRPASIKQFGRLTDGESQTGSTTSSSEERLRVAAV